MVAPGNVRCTSRSFPTAAILSPSTATAPSAIGSEMMGRTNEAVSIRIILLFERSDIVQVSRRRSCVSKVCLFGIQSLVQRAFWHRCLLSNLRHDWHPRYTRRASLLFRTKTLDIVRAAFPGTNSQPGCCVQDQRGIHLHFPPPASHIL